MGGYAATDGRQVKRGVLYRSDDLADLSSQDLEMLAELGLRRVFDMRHVSERLDKPDRLPGNDGIAVFEIPIYFPPLDRAESRRKILDGEVEKGHFEQLLIEANQAFALDYTSQWNEILQGLTAPDALPALIHCVDGKDRTGFVVALILRAVGVPQETILEDYLLSNRFFQSRIDWYAFLGSLGSLFRVSSSEIRPLLEVRRAYLESAFAAIDEQYGSFTAYLHEGLGLDTKTLNLLRLALLE